jgi:hypothetical protein
MIANYPCMVSVYLDKEYKYDSIEEVAKSKQKDIVHHLFEDYRDADDYCKLLKDINSEFLGKFLFKTKYIKD